MNFDRCFPISDKEAKEIFTLETHPFFLLADKNNAVAILKKRGDGYYYNLVSSFIEVKRKLCDVDSGKCKLDVEIYNGLDSIRFIADCSILTSKGVDELVECGVTFNTGASADFLKYLLISEEKAPIENSHNQLGWSVLKGETVFKTGTLISSDSSNALSTYTGSFDLTPCGNREAWFEMVRNDVIGNTPLTVVMLMGFASPILGYLGSTYDLGSVLFNLSNTSSKGKTTAAMLAASVFGNPAIDKSTLITFNATGNALVSFTSQCNSHTVVLDDAIISTSSDLVKQLYTLCAGKDKLRLNSDGDIKKTATFSSVIISTAEFELVSDSAPNGIRTRAFELKSTFTSSAQNSVDIKRTVIKNYGFAGAEFVKYIINEKLDSIENDYINCQSNLLSRIQAPGELTERVVSKLALLLQAAIYFNECFKIELYIDDVIDYLLDIEQSVNEGTVDNTAVLLNCIEQFVTKNSHRFIKGTAEYEPDSPLGRIITNGTHTTVTILKTEVDRIIADNHIQNARAILEDLKSQGVLEAEKDRLTKRVLFLKSSLKPTCYIFKISKQL